MIGLVSFGVSPLDFRVPGAVQSMIELIQFPWSPFCIVQRKLLEYSGCRFRIRNIPCTDRSLVWRLTRRRYYGVPVLREGRAVLFETAEDSQVIAKYIDSRLGLGMFPVGLEGVQSILWRHIEEAVESPCFRLNDAYYEEIVPAANRLDYLRFKERKFGKGCLAQWHRGEAALLLELEQRLLPFEEMLHDHPFLLGDRPYFVDFDLFGMLGNFLYSGHYKLPAAHRRLKRWHGRMNRIQQTEFT